MSFSYPLYDPKQVHDACGTGFIAERSGQPSRRVVERALQAVSRLSHRGASGADEHTGDGGGLLTDIPHELFSRFMEHSCKDEALRPHETLAVGMVFTSTSDQRALLSVFRKFARKFGFRFLGRRIVPVNISALGEVARQTCPLIIQIFLACPTISKRPVESDLYLLRRSVENDLLQEKKPAFICSLSTKTIVYKGLMKANFLIRFYQDLQDESFVAKVALFHERYSTNTTPNWNMAQPFRLLAHNGEINTIKGNRLWMRARERELSSEFWGADLQSLVPAVSEHESDSFSFDNVLEFLMRSGRGMFRSLMMLVPEPYTDNPNLSQDLKDFYIYHENLMEPWDGPAALVVTDGDFVGAKMDRNGLRPLRYSVTKDGLVIMASEAGVIPVKPDNLEFHHHMIAGEMFSMALDGRGFMENAQLKAEVAGRTPYSKIIKATMRIVVRGEPAEEFHFYGELDSEYSRSHQIALGWSAEDLDRYIIPMAKSGREPLGSMGDDTPPAFLSQQPRRFYDYFKHNFAQVTNPPLDPIRERYVTSLFEYLGSEGNLLATKPTFEGAIRVESPILSPRELDQLTDESTGFPSRRIDCTVGIEDDSAQKIEALLSDCEQAVQDGVKLLLLTDESVRAGVVQIPMPLMVSALHHRLIKGRVRSKVSIVCIAGDVLEDHHVATLIALGASVIYPYMAYYQIRQQFEPDEQAKKLAQYRYALEKGLIKIMAKSGISVHSSYHGSMLLHGLGLSNELLDTYFPSITARTGGIGLKQVLGDLQKLNTIAFEGRHERLPERGRFRYRKGREKHGFAPVVFKGIQSVAAGDQNETQGVAESPIYLRDYLQFKTTGAVPLDQVEPVEKLLARFGAGAISFGAISEESHRMIAQAMNSIGGRSNTGEGGEHPDRYDPANPDPTDNCYVKQIASGRFGVHAAYLAAAAEIQIKIAQGAKPGEGGQLPGHKVSVPIAAVRNSTPGVPLISPPPHHDIYSIEDIAQLIYDLKQVNPRAAVSVKLVAQPGVGTIASGVVKGGADIVVISGGDGGSGASPIGSLKHTGLPWELGLAEAHQVLHANDLRERVTLRVDGGLRNARDVIMAALLGAEEFDFGTSLLVALGCVMARQCHLNTCPAGIATQDERLQKRFKGRPDHIVAYLTHLAEDIRALMSTLGVYSLGELTGRTDLLERNVALQSLSNERGLDLSAVLNPNASKGLPIAAGIKYNPRRISRKRHIDEDILVEIRAAIMTHDQVVVQRAVSNTDRAVGTRLAGELALLFGQGNFRGNIQLGLTGIAGQSLGAFLIDGIELRLLGAANDYVGKGMSGGIISVRFEKYIREHHTTQTIMGNVALYGATGGALFVGGAAGERFAVRNSGAVAVVEGVGNHCCEYMTRGVVIVLGSIGLNFGAGMSGGAAYIYTADLRNLERLNTEYVRTADLSPGDSALLKRLLKEHLHHTGSPTAKTIMKNWDSERKMIMKIVPRALDIIDFEEIYNQQVAIRMGELLNE